MIGSIGSQLDSIEFQPFTDRNLSGLAFLYQSINASTHIYTGVSGEDI